MSSRARRTAATGATSASGPSNPRKRARDAPDVPKDTRKNVRSKFGLKAVDKDGKRWYQTHDETKYYADVPIHLPTLTNEFPRVLAKIRELHLDFLFNDPLPCNVSIVREFYANMSKQRRPDYVKVRNVQVNCSPIAINEALGTPTDGPEGAFQQLCRRPPYRLMRHTLAGSNSVARWIRHAERGYHLSFPFSYLTKEARVWVKIVLHAFFPGQHISTVTRDRICLAFALMTATPINIGEVFSISMWKARNRKSRRYAFGRLITALCLNSGVEVDEAADYYPVIDTTPQVVTHGKGVDDAVGPVLTTAQRNIMDDQIKGHMFGLEMLRHKTGGRPSTQEELLEVEQRYPLNAHARAVLGIGPQFVEPIDDDIPTDEGEEHDDSSDEDDDLPMDEPPLAVDGEPVLMDE